MPLHNECSDLRDVNSPLVCHLPIGHQGPHYDGDENVTWKVGEPDD